MFLAVVVSHKAPRKLQLKLLELSSFLFCTCVSGVEDVGIRNGHLEEEPKNISVELSTLQPHMVVPTQLIIPINSSHVGIVEGHCCRACDTSTTTITFSPLNCVRLL